MPKYKKQWKDPDPRRPLMERQRKELMLVVLLRNQQVMEAFHAELQSAMFDDFDRAYASIWAMAQKLYQRTGQLPDESMLLAEIEVGISTVPEWLNSEDVRIIEDFVDFAYDDQRRPRALNSPYYTEWGMRTVKEYMHERIAAKIQRLTMERTTVPADLQTTIDALKADCDRIAAISVSRFATFGEEWDEHEQQLAQLRGRDLVGLRTGMAELDRRTLGLRGVFLLAAMPGVGKTTYSVVEIGLGVCRHFLDNDAVVLVLSLEMPRQEIYTRLRCSLGGMDWSTLVFGSAPELRQAEAMFSAADQERLEQAQQRREEYQLGQRLVVVDHTQLGENITAARIAVLAQDLKTRAGASRAIIIVDYLQLLPVPEETADRGDLEQDRYRIRLLQDVNAKSRTASNPTGDTVLAISEARKPSSSKEDWGQSLSELMGSARLGYAADGVLLYRTMGLKEMEKYYGTKTKEAAHNKQARLVEQGISPAMLTLEKGRDGMTRGGWGVEFHFRQSRFVELQTQRQKVVPSCQPPQPRAPRQPGGSATNVASAADTAGANTGDADDPFGDLPPCPPMAAANSAPDEGGVSESASEAAAKTATKPCRKKKANAAGRKPGGA